MRNNWQIRKFVVLHGLVFALAFFATGQVQAENSTDLKIEFAHNTQTQIKASYQHSGRVIIVPEEKDKEDQLLPLGVTANMTYFQRTTGADQAVRYFEKANAKIKLEKGTTNPVLSPSNQLVIARLKSSPGEKVEIASLAGTLVQSELELIQNPADPLTWASVFSKTNVKPGDQWKPANEDLAKFLGVHKITKSDVQLKLKKIDARSARLYLTGSVEADVDDVATDIKISGVANVDRKANNIVSLKLGIEQTRDPGQIAPGFIGKTKIDIQVTPNRRSDRLSNASLAKYTRGGKIRQRLKWDSESGHFSIAYEPRWKMIAAEKEAAIFRYIDKGELLTQCNVVQLPSRPANNMMTLDAYKAEVAKIVAKDKNAKLESAKQFKTAAGLNALRVIVSGDEEGVPLNWIYYHVAQQDGRQVTFVFTLEESVAERVVLIANQLVKEFKFNPAPKVVARKLISDSESRSQRDAR